MILCYTHRSVIIREASPGQQMGTDAESRCQILGRECKVGSPSNPSPQSSENPTESKRIKEPEGMKVTRRTGLLNQLSKAHMSSETEAESTGPM